MHPSGHVSPTVTPAPAGALASRADPFGRGPLTMHGVLGIVCFVAAFVFPCSNSRAAEKTMPIDFVGDWCFDSQDKNRSWYTLPSWTTDGHCTKILSVNKYGFYGESRHCEPLKMRLEKSVAPSGIGYTATITARCQPDGPVTAGELQTFEFYRYKGNFSVIVK
jgi:hypothetical protein